MVKAMFSLNFTLININAGGDDRVKIDFSDHWSFWQESYPAVMITDTAFYRNPNYHSDSDTYEKLDYESMQETVKGFEVVLRNLAE